MTDPNLVWVVAQEAERAKKEASYRESLRMAEEVKARKEEIRKSAGLGTETGK